MADAKTNRTGKSRAGKKRKRDGKGYIVAAGAGGVAGFGVTRLLAGKQAADTVAGLLASQITAATYGPVIAVGMASAASIVCAVAIPIATIRALDQESKRDIKNTGAKHEKE